MSHLSLLIIAAVSMVALAAIVVALSRRRGDKVSVAVLAVGLPGVYLGRYGTLEGVRWPYLPAGVLIIAGAAIQVSEAIRPGRAAAWAKRVPVRTWVPLAAVTIALGGPAGTLIYWQTQPAVTFAGSLAWWSPEDAAHAVQTQEADGAASIVPLRPGHIQGFAVFVYNPSDVSQRILGATADSISPGAPVPPQIAVSTTGSVRLSGVPHWVQYRAGGTIPPHSYRWLRVLWRSYQCYLEGPGGSQSTDVLTLRVKVGWITRTEDVRLGAEIGLSPITKWPAWCNGHQPQP